MLHDFINDICDILQISVPFISFDTSNFPTNTMMAQCKPDGSVIYLKEYDKPNPDQLFSIAHELRHVWQIHHNENLYFSGYKPVELCVSIDEYNLQIAEIDANAFAGMVMTDFFQLKPLFIGLSAAVKSKVYERMEYLGSTDIFH